MYIYKNKLL